jgi:hypothetical protein
MEGGPANKLASTSVAFSWKEVGNVPDVTKPALAENLGAPFLLAVHGASKAGRAPRPKLVREARREDLPERQGMEVLDRPTLRLVRVEDIVSESKYSGSAG